MALKAHIHTYRYFIVLYRLITAISDHNDWNVMHVHIFTSSIFQLYPFGYASGDAALSYPSFGEGSSSSISLNNSIYFYDEMIRTAYVRYKLKANSYIATYMYTSTSVM